MAETWKLVPIVALTLLAALFAAGCSSDLEVASTSEVPTSEVGNEEVYDADISNGAIGASIVAYAPLVPAELVNDRVALSQERLDKLIESCEQHSVDLTKLGAVDFDAALVLFSTRHACEADKATARGRRAPRGSLRNSSR